MKPAATQAIGYGEFLHRKSQLDCGSGFAPLWMPESLFDFQAHLVDWALRQGRAALFADTGLGKTLMQLTWAENVVRKTGKQVLIMAPLAVSAQTQREGQKFGIEVHVSRDGSLGKGITITNYERLHYFNPADFVGAVADESSAIKAFDGKRRKQVVRFFSKLPYRLLASATPAPNDFIELGTNSEALGVMPQSDMLGYFFRETKNMRHTVFRDKDAFRIAWHFKPHSERPFWRWVASWARAIRSPEDLGFDGSRFILPPLNYHNHIVDVEYIPPGELFPRPAITLHEAHAERLRTINERCEYTANLVNHDRPAIVWCHFNEEGDALEKLIPGCVQIAGKHSLEDKEAKLIDFAMGNVRCLVTKGKIGCWGLNLQHCGDMTMFPSHSFEQMYQGIRRCWRFGRKGPVNVHMIASPGESKVTESLKGKQEKSERMFRELVRHMKEATSMSLNNDHNQPVALPTWLNCGSEELLCP